MILRCCATGPYYAILVKVSDDKVSGPPPFDELMIFRSDGLSHILTILRPLPRDAFRREHVPSAADHRGGDDGSCG
jgi:hypothetical protein